MGTRGTAEIREKEARRAAEILGAEFRETLDLGDGGLRRGRDEELAVIDVIRREKPRDRSDALSRRPPPRPPARRRARHRRRVLRGPAQARDGASRAPAAADASTSRRSIPHEPDFVVDVTPYIETRRAAMRAFESQFHDPGSTEPQTMLVAAASFLDVIEARARQLRRADRRRVRRGLPLAPPAPHRRSRRRRSRDSSRVTEATGRREDRHHLLSDLRRQRRRRDGARHRARRRGATRSTSSPTRCPRASTCRASASTSTRSSRRPIRSSSRRPTRWRSRRRWPRSPARAKLDLLHVHYALPHAISAILAREMGNGNGVPPQGRHDAPRHRHHDRRPGPLVPADHALGDRAERRRRRRSRRTCAT